MRITVVGGILIIVAVAACVLLFLALKETVERSNEQQIGSSQQDPFLQN